MTRTVVALLATSAVVAGIAVASDVAEYRILDALTRDALSVSARDVRTSDLRQTVIGAGQTILYLATAVAFIVWLRRAYRNLVPLGAGDLRWAPGWAVGGWFVPVLNLWRPKQIVNDVWRASDPGLAPGSTSWHGRRVPAGPTLWWILFLVGGAASTSAGAASLGEGPAALRDAALLFVVADGLDVATALLAIWVVRSITARQEERAALQGSAASSEGSRATTPLVVATAAMSVALAGVGLVLFTPDITPSGVPSATRGTDGDVASAGVIPIEELRPGDCFEEPTAADGTQPIFGVELVPCDEPHGFEVFAAVQLPAAGGAPFPGEDEAFEQAVLLCDEAFASTVAVGATTPVLDLYVINPSPESWAVGDREVLCGVYRFDGQELDAPVERLDRT